MTNDDLVTFILVLRYSGLRIGDASLLTNGRIDGDKLYLYTQKSGQHVYVPLPPYLAERLKQIRLRHGRYYFTGPRSLPMDSAADAPESRPVQSPGLGRITAIPKLG